MTVLVGPDAQKFEEQRAILEDNSDYFKAALAGPWQEAESGIIRIEDIEPKICRCSKEHVIEYTLTLFLS